MVEAENTWQNIPSEKKTGQDGNYKKYILWTLMY